MLSETPENLSKCPTKEEAHIWGNYALVHTGKKAKDAMKWSVEVLDCGPVNPAEIVPQHMSAKVISLARL
jgi:hypothetical protein